MPSEIKMINGKKYLWNADRGTLEAYSAHSAPSVQELVMQKPQKPVTSKPVRWIMQSPEPRHYPDVRVYYKLRYNLALRIMLYSDHVRIYQQSGLRVTKSMTDELTSLMYQWRRLAPPLGVYHSGI